MSYFLCRLYLNTLHVMCFMSSVTIVIIKITCQFVKQMCKPFVTLHLLIEVALVDIFYNKSLN